MVDIAGTINGLIGKDSMARQFFVWNVASAVASAGMDPFIQALQNDVRAKHPEMPLSPPDLADMVVRGVLQADEARPIAAKSGVSGTDFDLLVTNTGEPPSPLDMVQLYKRGEVSHDDVVRAIKQSRSKNEWIDTYFLLGKQPPTPPDILDAAVKGQITLDDARTLYDQLGGDPKYFDLMFHTVGEGPTPDQAAEMARRGIIDWTGQGPDVTSFHQAFLEGHFRNKWEEPYKKLSNYVPPPRTVTALYNNGGVDKTQAAQLFAQSGLDPSLTEAFLTGSSRQKTVKHRDLAESLIKSLYQDKAIDVDTALSFLEALGYDDSEANYIITVWDLERTKTAIETAIKSTHSHFVAHKIDNTAASLQLAALGVPSAQISDLVATWQHERDTNVKLLTPAEIKKAATEGLLSGDDAVTRLVDQGYTSDDALIYMSL